MMKNSYFMRILYLDEDVGRERPILIKIPLTVLTPSPNMLKLLTALEEFYDVECYLTISNIEEISDEKICIIPFGLATQETMLVTTCFDNVQFLYSITSVYGEYELLALDKEGHSGLMMVDQNLADYLGLEYIEELTDLHHSYLESINCGESQEYVYFPSALYS